MRTQKPYVDIDKNVNNDVFSNSNYLQKNNINEKVEFPVR